MEQGRQDRRLPARLGLRKAGRVAVALVLSLELCLAAFANEHAQNFPARPVRLVVNFPAGSGTADAVARALSEYLTRKWGQPVTVDNIPGATGLVGAEAAYRAEPDGYTLLVTPAGALTVAQHLQKLAYDPTRFVPISMLETSPIVAAPGGEDGARVDCLCACESRQVERRQSRNRVEFASRRGMVPQRGGREGHACPVPRFGGRLAGSG